MFFTVWMLVSGGETLEAQTNRKIKALQTQKKEIQKGLTRSRKELKTTEKTVATKLRDISMIANLALCTGLQVGGKSFAFRAFHPFCDSDVPSFALCPGICQLSAYVG